MKAVAVWVVALWFAVVLEHSRPDLFASCSLVVPVGVGCLLWHRSSIGLILTTGAMLLRWLVGGDGFPVEIAALLIGATVLLLRQSQQRSPVRMRMNAGRIGDWVGPVLLAAISVLAHVLGESTSSVPTAFGSRAIIAGPLLAGVLVVMRATDELGLRRHL